MRFVERLQSCPTIPADQKNGRSEIMGNRSDERYSGGKN